jgi:hypothetical protein
MSATVSRVDLICLNTIVSILRPLSINIETIIVIPYVTISVYYSIKAYTDGSVVDKLGA